MSYIDFGHLDQLKEIGGQELINELMNIFVTEAPQLTEKFKSFNIETQQDDIGKLAHKMKSSSASLGLTHLSGLCYSCEQKVRDNSFVTFNEINEIVENIQKAVFEISTYQTSIK